MPVERFVEIIIGALLVFSQAALWYIVKRGDSDRKDLRISIEHLHKCVHEHIEEFIRDHAPFEREFGTLVQGQLSMKGEVEGIRSMMSKMHEENRSDLRNISQRYDNSVIEQLRQIYEENRQLRRELRESN